MKDLLLPESYSMRCLFVSNFHGDVWGLKVLQHPDHCVMMNERVLNCTHTGGVGGGGGGGGGGWDPPPQEIMMSYM